MKKKNVKCRLKTSETVTTYVQESDRKPSMSGYPEDSGGTSPLTPISKVTDVTDTTRDIFQTNESRTGWCDATFRSSPMVQHQTTKCWGPQNTPGLTVRGHRGFPVF